jgi:hypothetical protein
LSIKDRYPNAKKNTGLHWSSKTSNATLGPDDPSILTPVQHQAPVPHHESPFEQSIKHKRSKVMTKTESPHSNQPDARPEDVATLDAIVTAMYDSISGPKGDRDWDRIRSLHLPGSHLIPTGVRANGENGLRVLDIEGWIDGALPLFEENDFYEVEVARHTDRFGNIAQAFSTYECRWEENGPAFMRGVNSIQLLKKDGRWWVVCVFWDNETEDNLIPEKFLP